MLNSTLFSSCLELLWLSALLPCAGSLFHRWLVIWAKEFLSHFVWNGNCSSFVPESRGLYLTSEYTGGLVPVLCQAQDQEYNSSYLQVFWLISLPIPTRSGLQYSRCGNTNALYRQISTSGSRNCLIPRRAEHLAYGFDTSCSFMCLVREHCVNSYS